MHQGRLFRADRGIYITEDGDLDDYYFFQLRNQRCIYSYQSALYLHGLTDRIPYQKEVTVYSGYNSSHIGKDVIVHYVKRNWYELGISEGMTIFGNPVRVYDRERTICDLILHRKEIAQNLRKNTWNKPGSSRNSGTAVRRDHSATLIYITAAWRLHEERQEGTDMDEVRQPRYNTETEAAMEEARDIAEGTIPAVRYASAKEMMDSVIAEDSADA